MRYIQELTLDVLQATKNKYIYAKQVDNDSRFLRITMMSGSTKIIPEENDSAIFRCEKPDKKSVLNPAAINQDGTVTVELTRQVLACTGTVKADVSIVNDNTVLSTVTFYIKVEKMPVTADQTVSSNEFLYLVEKVQEAEQFLKRGGTTGQVLKKKSNDDFDTEWGDDEGGGGSAIDVGAVPQVTGEFLYNNGSKIEDPKWHNKTVQCTTDYQEYQAWYFYKIRNDGDGAVRTDVQPQPDIPQIEHIQKSGADLDEIIDVIDGNIYQCTSNYSTDKSSISNDTQFHQGYFYLYNGEQAQYTYTRKDTQPAPNTEEFQHTGQWFRENDNSDGSYEGKIYQCLTDHREYTEGCWYKGLASGWEQIDVQPPQDISGKVDKVTNAVEGHIPEFGQGGALLDSGKTLDSLNDYYAQFFGFSIQGNEAYLTAIYPDGSGNYPTTIFIPSSYRGVRVTHIIDDAFFNKSIEFDLVVIPDTVTEIGDRAFGACSIKELHLGKFVESIGEECFANKMMETLYFSHRITTLGEGAFQGAFAASTDPEYDDANVFFDGTIEQLDDILSNDNPSKLAFNDCVIKFGYYEKDDLFSGAYADLPDKPKINNVTLSGDKSASDLGLLGSSDTLPVGSVEVDANSIKPYDYEQTYTIPNDITSGSTVRVEFAHGLREFTLEITTPETVIAAGTGYFYLTLDNGNGGGRFWEPALGQSHASKLCVSFTVGRDGIYRLNGYKYDLTNNSDYSLMTSYNTLARQNIGRLFLENPRPIASIYFTSGGDISELAGSTIKVRGLKW